MPIQMQCPNCQQPLTVADHLAGKRINCPKCKNPAVVPEQGVPGGGPSIAPAPMPSPGQAHDDVDDELALNIPGQDHIRHEETGEHKRCPGCGRDLPAPTVLCTGCGHDFRTGQRRKGFEIKDPDKTRRLIGTIVRNGVVIVLLIVGVCGIYYAYSKGLLNPNANEKKEEEEKKEEVVKNKPVKKKETKPVTVKDSLLVVRNNRFSNVQVYVDREKAGEVGYRKTEKIPITPPPADAPVQISFSAELPPGHVLDNEADAALKKGISFQGTTKQGLSVTITGPAEDMVPADGEVLKGVLVDLEVIKNVATGFGQISVVKYKDCKIKPVPPQKKLCLTYGEQDKRKVVKWVVQECIIERGGKKAYAPSTVPMESFGVGLVVKDGKVDVER